MSLNYIMLGSNDVATARLFYDAVFPVIGGKLIAEYMPNAFCYELRDGGRVWISNPFNNETATPGNGNMAGFLCSNKEEVDAVYKKALAEGATDEGSPGPRPLYGPDFYGSYIRDLDGNKMSFVHFGD
ncbi:MAG: VOC family protein [Pseudomonadota bacterium]